MDAPGPVASDVATWDLGRGENHGFPYAHRHERWAAVIDDEPACRRAEGLDIPGIGTFGGLAIAKTEGHLEAIRAAVRALQQAGLHVSKDIVNHVLQMAGEA